MLEESELVNLLMSIVATFVLVSIAKKIKRDRLYFFFAAFTAMLVSFIFTNLEVFFWHDLLNNIEHSLLAIAGILFAIGCWQLGNPEKASDN